MKNLFSGFNFSFSAWTWQAGKTAGFGWFGLGERYHRILEKKEVFEIIFENSVHNPKIGCWNLQKRKKNVRHFLREFLNYFWILTTRILLTIQAEADTFKKKGKMFS